MISKMQEVGLKHCSQSVHLGLCVVRLPSRPPPQLLSHSHYPSLYRPLRLTPLSIVLSLSLSSSLSTPLSIVLSVYPCLYRPLPLSLRLPLVPSVYPSLYRPLRLPLPLSSSPSICLSCSYIHVCVLQAVLLGFLFSCAVFIDIFIQ